jgi:hypothetical protein
MNEAVCLYCEKPERNYKPSKGVDFICSRCVMAFLSADQDYLKWVHDRAIKNSMPDKARAIESFILPEETDGSIKPKKHERHTHRKRSLRLAANKKIRIKQVKVREETTVL